MKKWLCLALAVLMVMSMAACGGEKKAKEGLQVGYGRAEINPANGVPLAGYGAVDAAKVNDKLIVHIEPEVIVSYEFEDDITNGNGFSADFGSAY